MKVDSLDKRIIGMLELDAAQSSEFLSRQLDVNPSTIRRRIQKLVQGRVMRITAASDFGKIGFPFMAVIAFDVATEKIDAVMEALSARPEITWLFATSGRFDVLALARFSSTDEIFNFMESQLGKIEGIKDAEILVNLQTMRRFGRPIV